ncbi:MAG: alkaline phosphatase, partial [Porticoccaceae bacterium]
MQKFFLLTTFCLFLNACDSHGTGKNPLIEATTNTTGNSWYQQAAAAVASTNGHSQKIATEPGSAKNIILFVGDGMGISTVTAARILEGQQRGMQGEENSLSFGRFPFVGLTKTYNVDAQTPDSAGS